MATLASFPVVLGQVRISPDLIGPAIFVLIFVGSWVWNGYQKAVRKRQARAASEEAQGRAMPERDDREREPRARGRSEVARAEAPAAAGGMSMRERIELARAEAAAGGRTPQRASAAQARPRPRLQPQPHAQPRPQPRPQVVRPAGPTPAAPRPPRPAPPRPATAERARAASPQLSRASGPIQTVQLGGDADAPPPISTVPLDRESMRRAIVTMEILEPPVALRGPDRR